ncbi:MAG: universal stress protein [Pseudooceanicola sp.]
MGSFQRDDDGTDRARRDLPGPAGEGRDGSRLCPAAGRIDLSPACESALRQACRLAPGADIATFHAVHVPFRGFTAPQGTAEQVGPFVDAAQAELDAWWDATDLPEAVARPEAQAAGRGELLSFKLRALEPDLLVIGAHGRPAFAATMLGGFTEEILRDPPCDVLVVRR